MPQDYSLFAGLAGVRAAPGFAPMIPPRGLPDDASVEVATRYFLPVLERERAVDWGIGEHFTPEQAKEHLESGRSHRIPDGTTRPLSASTDAFISNPDWHSASWLTAQEIEPALLHANHPLSKTPDEFQLLVEYLTESAERLDRTGRLVFWFDN